MRILVLPKLLPRSDIIGGPILIYHRVKNLSRMGHDITILSPAYSEDDIQDRSLNRYARVIKVPMRKEKTREEVEELKKELNRPEFYLTGDGGYSKDFDRRFRHLITREDFDVIIAEYSIMGQYIEEARDIIKERTLKVTSVHECYTKAFELRREKGEDIDIETIEKLKNYEFKVYRSSDLVLTLTDEDREILLEIDNSLEGKIEVVPHGVDTDFYYPPDKCGSSRNILYTGNYLHHPNVDAVLNFMNKCWGKIKEKVKDAKFYAIGYSPPPEILKFQNEDVKVMPGGDNERMRSFYWLADVFVAPIELGTGFRGKILEALACGLPVVATELALYGVRYIEGEGIFMARDYDEFADYVSLLLLNEELRKEMSKMARSVALRYDHKVAAYKLERVLGSHLKGGGR